jgi:hypothetical protein
MGQGTGPGLAHVRAFCDQAGGAVELASELGVGTTLKLSLPRASRIPAACAEEAASVAPLAKQGLPACWTYSAGAGSRQLAELMRASGFH